MAQPEARVRLSAGDRIILMRIVKALENLSPQPVDNEPSRHVRLEESAAAQEDDSVLFPYLGPDGVVRHV